MFGERKKRSIGIILLNYLLVCIAIILFFWISLERIGVVFNMSFLWDFRTRILQGFAMTVALSLLCMIFSLMIGILCAVALNTDILFLNYFCKSYCKL